jgi:hypothetical protein
MMSLTNALQHLIVESDVACKNHGPVLTQALLKCATHV